MPRRPREEHWEAPHSSYQLQSAKRVRLSSERGDSNPQESDQTPAVLSDSINAALAIKEETNGSHDSATSFNGEVEPIKARDKLYTTIATSTTGLAALSLVETSEAAPTLRPSDLDFYS